MPNKFQRTSQILREGQSEETEDEEESPDDKIAAILSHRESSVRPSLRLRLDGSSTTRALPLQVLLSICGECGGDSRTCNGSRPAGVQEIPSGRTEKSRCKDRRIEERSRRTCALLEFTSHLRRRFQDYNKRRCWTLVA